MKLKLGKALEQQALEQQAPKQQGARKLMFPLLPCTTSLLLLCARVLFAAGDGLQQQVLEQRLRRSCDHAFLEVRVEEECDNAAKGGPPLAVADLEIEGGLGSHAVQLLLASRLRQQDLIAAASPVIDDTSSSRNYQPKPPFNLPSVPASLAKAGLTWGSYGTTDNYFHEITALKGSPNIKLSAHFDTDVAAGNGSQRRCGQSR